ncbi:hypothetical protein ACLESO_36695 [Pyxidicoccus sp. 3LG]
MEALSHLRPLLLVLLLAPAARAQLTGTAQADRNLQVRIDAATFQRSQPLPTHANNGDEALYPTRFASYSKGLPHNQFGEPDLVQYDQLLLALMSGNPADFEAIVLGGPRQLVNPQAGFSLVLEGASPQAITMRPAPTFTSAEASGEMEELYWMSLVRDVRFDNYTFDTTISQAATRLSQLQEYRGARASNGMVTPGTLFRADISGAVQGPFISQFLVKPIPYGGGPREAAFNDPVGVQLIEQRNLVRRAGDDRVTAYSEWLSIQNGAQPSDPTDSYLDYESTRRYIRNARDLTEFVHLDYPIQATLHGALLLARQGDFTPGGTYDPDPKSSPRAHDPNNPYRNYAKQEPFVTFGNSEAQSVAALVTNTVLRGQWFQKWQVHRRLRPEEYGGRVHNTLTGSRIYPVPSELLASPALPTVLSRNAQRNAARGLGIQGTYLLSQAFPEGSPVHPAYASGHSTYTGAGVTIIKAFYADFPIINPVIPSSSGTSLVPYGGTLMMFDELDKLASNIGVGRLFAGVHYRSDHDHAVRLGELMALRTLQDWSRLYNEPFQGFQVRTLGGNTVTVTPTGPALPNFVSATNSFTLINATTDQPVPGFDPLYNGAVIDLSDLAAQGVTQLTIRANTYQPTVGSVRFAYDSTTPVNDSTFPYSLAGETSPTDYNPFTFTTGSHVLRATPFSEANGDGVGGVPLAIRFTVQN